MSALTDGLAHRFTDHPVRPLEIAQMTEVRQRAFLLARTLTEMCPEGRELSLALTNLEQVMFWANAGIARSAP
jgi:hypothetical protein